MLEARTVKAFAALLALYALACLGAWFGPPPLAEPSSWLILVPFLTSHVLHRLGAPGMLEHDGQCGWGWCSPTPLGWALTAVFGLAVLWLLAWAIARLVKSDRAGPPRAGL